MLPNFFLSSMSGLLIYLAVRRHCGEAICAPHLLLVLCQTEFASGSEAVWILKPAPIVNGAGVIGERMVHLAHLHYFHLVLILCEPLVCSDFNWFDFLNFNI